MTFYEENKAPLTLVNVLSWARNKFSDAFDALPGVGYVTFEDIDNFNFSRPIRRSLGRSEHQKLLLVGAHAPGDEVEDALVCAHIHAGDNAISYFRIVTGANGERELHAVRSTGHIAFRPPFSGVGDDVGDAKAIHRVEAIISYYFLAAGHLQELVRYEDFTNSFFRGFAEGCRWIENEGERPPTTSASVRECIIDNGAIKTTAIKSNPKRVALDTVASNTIHKLPIELREEDTARLKVHIATLTTEKADLLQNLAMQGHAYRGCQLDLDETREEVTDLKAALKASKEMNVELQAGIKKIKEFLNKQEY